MQQQSIVRAASFSRALVTATLLTGFAVLMATSSADTGGPVPGDSRAFGRTLAQWQEVYWRWAFGQVDIPVDCNGNPVVGDVVLMPLPNAPGDGTPGTIDVTLNPGQSFVLPLWNILETSWDDGTPTDPLMGLSVFQTLNITLAIDGVTVLDGNNVMNYYSEVAFDPEIPLPPEWSPYLAIVRLQGIGVVHSPLSAGAGGHHRITLDVKNTSPVIDGKGNAYVFEYHNTWNITVTN